MTAAVVKLNTLTDSVRATAQNHNLLDKNNEGKSLSPWVQPRVAPQVPK
jgi:hypothetical protein